jgi:acetyltransferase-like isoleucine patch superfamily enzyme
LIIDNKKLTKKKKNYFEIVLNKIHKKISKKINHILVNVICFFIINKKNRKNFRLKYKQADIQYQAIIKGNNNKIIIYDSNGVEHINILRMLPSGFDINIDGDNNIIKLHLPIKVSKFSIKIRKCRESQCSNNLIEIFSIIANKGVTISFQDSNNQLIIGKGTFINDGLVVLSSFGNKTRIGERCLISYSEFWATDYHVVYDNITKQTINKQKDCCIIGNHCWLGAKTIFLKNAKIAEDSIVGIGSVVSKEFKETNVVIAGNPAQIVKREINWTK